MKKIFATVLLVLPAIVLFAAPVLAATTPPPGGGGTTPPGGGGTTPVSVQVVLENPFKVGNNIYDVLIYAVENVLMPIAAILCVLAFIYAGFLYVTAQGNPGQISTAHRALLYAAIGTAILLGAQAIALAVKATLTNVLS